jgi:hypothetical protein
MATKKITDLVELISAASGDVLPIVDISDDITKKIQVSNFPISTAAQTAIDAKQDTLVSGTNIKTINSTSLLSSGDVAVQETLVSGTNIKTLNSESLLGSGNIEITASPAGVAGAIQFSDGSAFASDAANLFWDDTNNRLGIGTNTPTATTHIVGIDQLSTSTSLLVQDSIGTNILRVHNQANNSAVVMTTAKIANYEIISGDVLFNTSMRFVPTTGGVAINKDYSSASSNTLVHLKGSGSTSATTALLVQNSAGNSALTILDNLNSQFGGTVTSDGGFRSIAYYDSFQRVGLNNGLNTNPQNYILSVGVGRVLLIDNSEADFNRLQFGGTTSSFPSLKRSTTNLQVRLADDSGYAPIDASLYKVGGTNGFTGTGSYTNFTIVGGIITNAS